VPTSKRLTFKQAATMQFKLLKSPIVGGAEIKPDGKGYLLVWWEMSGVAHTIRSADALKGSAK
jgi:hypothetical protein